MIDLGSLADSERPYTDEELATAHQAAKDFVDGMGEAGQYVTARDLAMFDAGFKQGRRTPRPATKAIRDVIRVYFEFPEEPGPWIEALIAKKNAEEFLTEWPRPAKTSGFTLIELLVVMLIIGLVTVIVLPGVVASLREHPVVSAAQLVQAAIGQARDATIRAGVQRRATAGLVRTRAETLHGVRLVPDHVTRLADGTVDPQAPLTCSKLVQLSAPPAYHEGRASVYFRGRYPAAVTGGRSCLVVEQSPGRWEPGIGGYAWLPNPPTSWAWNVRAGEKFMIGTRTEFVVCGPMDVPPGAGNPEQFVNYGAAAALTRLYTSPDGLQSVTAAPEFLWLANSSDDDGDGYTDDGWDGIDNDNDGATDEPDEWEVELWPPDFERDMIDIPYRLARRPVPDPARAAVDLPRLAVIDLTGWAGADGRSRVVVNRHSGTVDLLIDEAGRFAYDLPYSGRAAIGMDAGAYAHLWIGGREDITDPASPPPPPRSDARLLTIGRGGMVSVLAVSPDDPGRVFLDARRGSR